MTNAYLKFLSKHPKFVFIVPLVLGILMLISWINSTLKGMQLMTYGKFLGIPVPFILVPIAAIFLIVLEIYNLIQYKKNPEKIKNRLEKGLLGSKVKVE